MAEQNLTLKVQPKGQTATDPVELTEIAIFLDGKGFRGNIKWYDHNGTTVWRLTVPVPGLPDQDLYISPASDPHMPTRLVWDGFIPRTFTESDFAERYEVEEE